MYFIYFLLPFISWDLNFSLSHYNNNKHAHGFHVTETTHLSRAFPHEHKQSSCTSKYEPSEANIKNYCGKQEDMFIQIQTDTKAFAIHKHQMSQHNIEHLIHKMTSYLFHVGQPDEQVIFISFKLDNLISEYAHARQFRFVSIEMSVATFFLSSCFLINYI